MIAHSSSSSWPGLLMIASGMCDLADVVQQRAELGLAALVLVEPSSLGDAHARARRRPRVWSAGVLVVVLEQVAEQQRGAAVGAPELDRLLDPRLALAREDSSSAHERQDEQEARARRGGERREQADRREQRVDEPDQRAARAAARAAGCRREPLAQRREAQSPANCAASASTYTRPVATPAARAGSDAARAPGPTRTRRRRRRTGAAG